MATTLLTCIMPTSWKKCQFPPASHQHNWHIWALRFNPIQITQPPEPHSAKYILIFLFQKSLIPSQGFRTLLRVTSSFENRFFQMTWQTDLWGRKNLHPHFQPIYSRCSFPRLLLDSKSKYKTLTVWEITFQGNGYTLNANLIKIELKS